MHSNGPQGHVLIVDDNVDFQIVARDLASLGHCDAKTATTLQEARKLARDERFDLIMIDLNLPDGNGLDLLDDIDLAAHGQFVVVTGYPTVESAMRAVRSPVIEYLLKPVEPPLLNNLFEGACLRAQMRRPVQAQNLGEMIGNSERMQQLFDRVRRVAPLDVSVLVHGESGTGKELIARAVHDLSGRAGRFVPVNCGAIPSELLSSQLFGHERGSFTGASQSHAGFFEQAEGGTLFLDEITEMQPALQVYLLRILEGHSVTRVGGSREIPVDVRVVAATNRDPHKAMSDGSIRADLYYRLMEFPLAVPALHERREDIPLLAQYFVSRLDEKYGTRKFFSPEGLRQLVARSWPGNVRELRHAVQRAYILADLDQIEAPPDPRSSSATAESRDSIHFHVGMTFDDIEREMLLKTLAYHGNNKRQAARALGITTKTIYNRLLRYRELGLVGDEQIGEPEFGHD